MESIALRDVPQHVRDAVQGAVTALSELGYSITSSYWTDEFVIFHMRRQFHVASVTLWNDDTITVYPKGLVSIQ